MSSFSFVQITDHHLRESESDLTFGYSSAYAFRTLVRHVAEHAARTSDFIVTMGDVVETPSETSYRTVRRMLGLADDLPVVDAPGPQPVSIEGLDRFPMYFLPGNHDDRHNFYEHLSLRPTPYSQLNATFEHKGVQFVCIDWGAGNQAVARPEMLAFLENALSGDTSSILLMHHQVVPVGVRWLDDLLSPDVGKFWDILRGKRVLGVFCGHLHATYEQEVEGIRVYGLRSTAPQFVLQDEPLLCIQPLHYRVVHVSPDAVTAEIVEVPL
jgi:3',5'-cyclic-AMP phosphodiesterase